MKPYHARAYPIPKIHEQTLRTEVERVCSIGVLRKVNRSEWVAPTFIKEEWNSSIHFGLLQAKQMDREEDSLCPENSRFTTKTKRFSVCNIFRLKHGLLPYSAHKWYLI